MADVEKLVIVGVGLLGGSVARAALERGVAREVVGLGRNAEKLSAAQKAGTITKYATDAATACRDTDLVVVCTPVDRIAADVVEVAAACNRPTLITDAGSTKGNIIAALPAKLPLGCRFVGSHPLAGSEKTGAEHAKADLFVGRMVILTPTTDSDAADVDRLESFWKGLGACVSRMDVESHDRTLAATSHVPHVVAAALALATDPGCLQHTAGGWLDCTRIAAADAALWQAIFAANRSHILKALDGFEKTLATLREAIAADDAEEVQRILGDAKAIRARAAEVSSAVKNRTVG
jgi:cyclohexadieny/prephenate dehydrogenase